MIESRAVGEEYRDQKKAILDSSPFTRHYLAEESLDGDSDTTRELAEATRKKLSAELMEQLGYDWRGVVIQPLYISAIIQGHMEGSLVASVTRSKIEDMFLMGYEVGAGIKLFFSQIMDRIEAEGVLNSDHPDKNHVARGCLSILIAGTHFKERATTIATVAKIQEESAAGSSAGMPLAIRDYIETLDMKGI